MRLPKFHQGRVGAVRIIAKKGEKKWGEWWKDRGTEGEKPNPIPGNWCAHMLPYIYRISSFCNHYTILSPPYFNISTTEPSIPDVFHPLFNAFIVFLLRPSHLSLTLSVLLNSPHSTVSLRSYSRSVRNNLYTYLQSHLPESAVLSSNLSLTLLLPNHICPLQNPFLSSLLFKALFATPLFLCSFFKLCITRLTSPLILLYSSS